MPDYIERYNVIVIRSTDYDELGNSIGQTYKEVILPLNWLVLLTVLLVFFYTIKRIIWPK